MQAKRILYIGFFFLSSALFSQSSVADSLVRVLQLSAQDTSRVNLLNTISQEYANEGDNIKAKAYALQAIKLAESLGFSKGEAYTYKMMGNLYFNLGDFPKALEFYFSNLQIQEARKDSLGMAAIFTNIGNAYKDQNNLNTALEYYGKATNIYEKKGKQNTIAYVNTLISEGAALEAKQDFTKALDYYLRVEEIATAIAYQEGLGDAYNNMGNVYKESNRQYDKALTYYQEALMIREKLGDAYFTATTLANIGTVYHSLKNNKEALNYGLKSLALAKEIGALDLEKDAEGLLAETYEELGDKNNAILHLKRHFSIKDTLFNAENVRAVAMQEARRNEEKMEASFKEEQIKQQEELKRQKTIRYAFTGGFALVLVLVFVVLRSLRQKKKSNKIITEQNKELEKLSIVASNSENTVVICDTNTELIWANESFTRTFGYTLEELKSVVGRTIYEISSNPDIKKLVNECIEKRGGVTYESKNKTKHLGDRWFQTTLSPVFDEGGKLKNIIFIDSDITEIKTIENELHDKNKEITDSITYAKRIQDAILPPIEYMKEKFPLSFVLYKPKDIVAGDFYWMEEINDTVLIAAADCTGHGVPGAMVSVVCSNALNRAVKEFNLEETGKILDKVTDLVLETFVKSTADVKDGMDISLLSVNTKTKMVQWSGANNPLWYFEKGELREITADKQPIGKSDQRKPFTTHLINYDPGASFYLFTDGYADQFGGPKGKKFKYKQLQDNLAAVLGKEMKVQQDELDITFKKWKGKLEQVDDVCIIGLKI